MELANKSDGIHPFDLDVNSFEVIGTPWDPSYHRLHDTIRLPPFRKRRCASGSNSGGANRSDHCHILPHEDTAMIGEIFADPVTYA